MCETERLPYRLVGRSGEILLPFVLPHPCLRAAFFPFRDIGGSGVDKNRCYCVMRSVWGGVGSAVEAIFSESMCNCNLIN